MVSTDPEPGSAECGIDAGLIELLESSLESEGRPVSRIDTHGAVVLIGGQTVFKIKRPVRFSYMDFSSLADRGRAIAAEIRLNRRTAPAFYLGIRPVIDDGGNLRLGALQSRVGTDGPLECPPSCVDWVLVMRRFDGDRLFSTLAEAGSLTSDRILALAERVHAFHAAESPARTTQIEAVRGVVDGNLDELAQASDLDQERCRMVSALSRQWVDRLAPQLEARARAGFVRHCHGDLHLGNVVDTADGPMMFDALEFDESFATIDTAYDSAFLVMDLDRFGLRVLANLFLNRLLELSGDYEALGPLPLFLSMRAAIRAKIGVSRAVTQSTSDAAEAALSEAAAYLERAHGYLEPADPVIVAVGGLSGTGKSSVARRLAPDLGVAPGAVVLRSDVLRKRLAGVSATTALAPEWYTPAATHRVYEMMAGIARQVAAAGHSVVLDAVASKPEERALFEQAAADSRFVGVWLSADPNVLKKRVAARTGDASDATTAVVERQLEYDIGKMSWTVVDAGRGLEAVADDALSIVHGCI